MQYLSVSTQYHGWTMSELSSTEEQFTSLLTLLDQLQLGATTHTHEAAFTVEEQAAHVSHLPGTLTKNLFLRDKKHGLFLVTTLATRDVNLKVVGTLLKLAGAEGEARCDSRCRQSAGTG
jgi:hypothetical protein